MGVKKRKKTRVPPGSILEELKEFFQSDLAQKAAAGLSSRTCVALHIEGKDFYFTRLRGKNDLSERENTRPDVHFWMSKDVMRHLAEVANQEEATIPQMGIAIFEHLFTSQESKKIKFRVDASFLALWSKGYFSVLKAGGPEVASYLARWGFDSLSRIKDILRSMRK